VPATRSAGTGAASCEPPGVLAQWAQRPPSASPAVRVTTHVTGCLTRLSAWVFLEDCGIGTLRLALPTTQTLERTAALSTNHPVWADTSSTPAVLTVGDGNPPRANPVSSLSTECSQACCSHSSLYNQLLSNNQFRLKNALIF
jgi:hypothetical protein